MDFKLDFKMNVNIEVAENVLTYNINHNKVRINTEDISELSLTEGLRGNKGYDTEEYDSYLKIEENGRVHKIYFEEGLPEELKELQKSLGFHNITEPESLTEIMLKDVTTKDYASCRNDITAARYSVTGKNPSTGGKETRIVVDIAGADKNIAAGKSRLRGPFEIEILKDNSPEIEQIDAIKELGIKIPDDASYEDAEIFIERAEKGEELKQPKAPAALLKTIISEAGIYMPAYVSENELDEYFWNGMTSSERLTYFAMRVYADAVGKNYRFLHEAEPKELKEFKNFALMFKKNKEFLSSFRNYNGADIPINGKINENTKAYMMAKAHFVLKNRL